MMGKSRRPIKRWLAIVALLCVSATLFFGIGFAWLERVLDTPLTDQESFDTVEIPRGVSLQSVVTSLSNTYQLKYPRAIVAWARWQQLDRSLKAGEYRVTSGMSVRQFMEMLTRGEVVTYQVTIPEGVTVEQALAIIQAQEPLSITLEGASDPRLLALVAPSVSVEGWLLPETYQYVRGDTDLAIVQRAHHLMQQTLQSLWTSRQVDLPLNSMYEALILASIVERETSVEVERSTIAGVFIRRLKRNMRLQTDPTVIYGLGADYDGNLTRRHLRDGSNAWNTYQHKGLPPTPIALPGVDAIRAAMQPAEGAALYFVAKGDGTHVFSESLEEHNANVRRYQLERKVNYRSTPARDS